MLELHVPSILSCIGCELVLDYVESKEDVRKVEEDRDGVQAVVTIVI